MPSRLRCTHACRSYALRTLVCLLLATRIVSAPDSDSGAGCDGLACSAQLLVIGPHSPRSVAVARLLSLLGFNTGSKLPDRAVTGSADLSSPWGLGRNITLLNQDLIQQHSGSKLPSWAASDFSAADLSAKERQRFTERAAAVVRKLNQRRPWLVKDTHFAYTAPLWLGLLDAPVCVLVYSHPAPIVGRLLKRWQALGHAPSLLLQRWEAHLLASLQACVGLPTIVIQAKLADTERLPAFYTLAAEQLARVGITGLKDAPTTLLTQQLERFSHAEAQAAHRNCTLRENLFGYKYAPLDPSQNALSLVQPDWPGLCPIRPTMTTRALMSAMEFILASQYVWREAIAPQQLAETALNRYQLGLEMLQLRV